MIYAIEALGSKGPCTEGHHQYGLVKFGKANNPENRLKVLGTGSPYQLRLLASVDWPDEIERLIHAAFKHRRVHGEWFESDDYILTFVTTMMCDHGATDEEKFNACMLILVEMFTGWRLYPGMKVGACRAPEKTEEALAALEAPMPEKVKPSGPKEKLPSTSAAPAATSLRVSPALPSVESVDTLGNVKFKDVGIERQPDVLPAEPSVSDGRTTPMTQAERSAKHYEAHRDARNESNRLRMAEKRRKRDG